MKDVKIKNLKLGDMMKCPYCGKYYMSERAIKVHLHYCWEKRLGHPRKLEKKDDIFNIEFTKLGSSYLCHYCHPNSPEGSSWNHFGSKQCPMDCDFAITLKKRERKKYSKRLKKEDFVKIMEEFES